MNRKILSKENTAPLIILFVSVLLLICMMFSILELVNHILLGVFGASTYILLLSAISTCVTKIIGFKNNLSKSFMVYLSIIVLSMLFITHVSMTASSYSFSFKECLEYPFANLTPAGAVFSLILYPLNLLLPVEGVIGLFVIAIIVFVCICIDKKFNNKHTKVAKKENASQAKVKAEKGKNTSKVQTMKVPNVTLEKNKTMPTFISMPLTLKAQMEKERKDVIDDLLTPTQPRTLNLKKQGQPKAAPKPDASIYSGTINPNIIKSETTPPSTISDDDIIAPIKPQKIFHTDNIEDAVIGKPSTILQEKNAKEFAPSQVGGIEMVDPAIQVSETIEDDFSNLASAKSEAVSKLGLDERGLQEKQGGNVTQPAKNNAAFREGEQQIGARDVAPIEPQKQEVQPEKPKRKKPAKYVYPPLELLTTQSTIPNLADNAFEAKAHIIEEKLEEFKISAKCIGVTRGPAITRYEFEMPRGVPVNKVLQYSNDISMVLESRKAIRIEAPIPGKNAFGVEVPNDKVDTIGLRDLIDCKEFRGEKSPLTFALGKDITNRSIMGDVGKLVHTLVAGSTGSGKSVCMNSIIISLLYKASPADVRIILIDPKYVEFAIYENMPHLLLPKIITEPAQAVNALNWACEEMERRNRIFGRFYVRSIDEYNEMPEVQSGVEEKMYKIVIMVDELNDLMMNARKDVEEKILKLAQKARSCGIHLILATQRPSVDVITGTIKANLPSRIAFSLTNYSDSKTIIDQGGAEKLLGRGDMLYSPRGEEPTRLLGPFVSQQEVSNILKFIKQHNECDYDRDIEQAILVKRNNDPAGGPADAAADEYFVQALRWAIEAQVCSTSALQRRFSIGYQRAARLVDAFEARGYISKADGSKPRQILISMEEFLKNYGNN